MEGRAWFWSSYGNNMFFSLSFSVSLSLSSSLFLIMSLFYGERNVCTGMSEEIRLVTSREPWKRGGRESSWKEWGGLCVAWLEVLSTQFCRCWRLPFFSKHAIFNLVRPGYPAQKPPTDHTWGIHDDGEGGEQASRDGPGKHKDCQHRRIP